MKPNTADTNALPPEQDASGLGWWRLLLFVPLVVLVLLLRFYAQIEIPSGHDSELHVKNTIILSEVIKHMPAETPAYLQTLPFRYPPLTYLTTAALVIVEPGSWAFFATTLFWGVIALFFFYRAALWLVRDKRLALLAVLLVMANPTWVKVAMSFNLEMTLLAALAIIMCLLLGRWTDRGWLTTMAVGLLAGVLLFSKAVALVHVAPMLAAFLWIEYRDNENKQAMWRALVFTAICLLLAAAWYAPQSLKINEEMVADIGSLSQPNTMPWWYYSSILFGGYAFWPFFLAVAAAVFGLRRRELPRQTVVPAVGALGGLLFFSAIGTKREWYVLGAYLLLLLAMLPVLDHARQSVRKIAVPILLVVYAILAVAPWIKPLHPLMKVAAPVIDPLPRVQDFRPSRQEHTMAQKLMQVENAHGLGGFEIILPAVPVYHYRIQILLYLADGRFAFLSKMRNEIANISYRLLNARYLMLVQPVEGATAQTITALDNADQYTVEMMHMLLWFGRLRDRFEEIERASLNADYDFLILQNREYKPSWSGQPSYQNLIDLHQVRHYQGHQRFLERAYDHCRAGRFDRADQLFDLFFRHDPQNQTAMLLYINCLMLQNNPPSEAKKLVDLLTTMQRSPPVIDRIVRRLYELERNEQVPGVFDDAAEHLLSDLPLGHPSRENIFRLLISQYIHRQRDDRALALVDRELAKLSPEQQPLKVMQVIRLAAQNRRDELTTAWHRRLSANPATAPALQAEADALLLHEQIADGRVDWDLLQRALATESTALSATSAIIEQSMRLRHEGRLDQALQLVSRAGTMVQTCAPCRRRVDLERARILAEQGDVEQARSLLKQLRRETDDSELVDVIRQLLHSLPR